MTSIMVDSTRKRARVEEEESSSSDGGGGDRISGLCNGILHHIFSFLPTTREVVQTCVLSKRWRNLWCSVPWLDFDEETFLASSSSSGTSSSSSSFSTFVNYAMLLRDGSSNIQKLRLSCSSSYSNRVFHYIVAAALKHNLQVLDLQILHHHQAAAENVLLPSSLFTCQSLTFLKLNNVVLPSYSASNICLSSLKTLHLISVKFPPSSNQLSLSEPLFENSPILETLTLHNCNFEHLEYFHISVSHASQLKNLIIIQDEEAPPSSSTSSITQLFYISAPNLTSLKLHEIQSTWNLLSNNSLVEANIHLKTPKKKLSFMIGIFRELQNVKAITLSGSCLEIIGEMINTSLLLKTSFHNLKLMKLTTCFEEYEVRGITRLLKRSPNIETLVIEYSSESSYEDNELSTTEKKLPSKCTLHHLKTIQMCGFGGRKNEVKLVTFLLENAKSLKKMIVEKEASI